MPTVSVLAGLLLGIAIAVVAPFVAVCWAISAASGIGLLPILAAAAPLAILARMRPVRTRRAPSPVQEAYAA